MANYFVIKKAKDELKDLDTLERDREMEIKNKIEQGYYNKTDESATSLDKSQIQNLEQQEQQLEQLQEINRIKKSISVPAKSLLTANSTIEKAIIDLEKILIDLDTNKEYQQEIEDLINKIKILNKKIKGIAKAITDFKDSL